MCVEEDPCDDDSPLMKCWCGAEGTYEELFSTVDVGEGCGGTGTINCYCGGDQCVCHNHGSTDCPGCDDCDADDWQDDEFEDDEDE